MKKLSSVQEIKDRMGAEGDFRESSDEEYFQDEYLEADILGFYQTSTDFLLRYFAKLLDHECPYGKKKPGECREIPEGGYICSELNFQRCWAKWWHKTNDQD